MKHQYISLNQIDTAHFSTCDGCETPCCDGKRFSFIPLILEDFDEVYQNFAIVLAKISNQWRFLMLLSKDDKSGCEYFKEGKCTIYDTRPPGCKLYPFSPFNDDILLDTSCPAVNDTEQGDFLASTEQINNNFYHDRLNDFNDKRKNTEYILTLCTQSEDDVSSLGIFNNIELFKYSGSSEELLRQPWMKMHIDSLKKL